MTDIVERLRAHDLNVSPNWKTRNCKDVWMDEADGLMSEAAAEIVRLRQELAEAREALAPFGACCFADNDGVRINSARLCSGDFLRAAMLTTFEQREAQRDPAIRSLAEKEG